MARKRIVNVSSDVSVLDVFPKFIASQEAKGVSEKTIKTYRQHLRSIGKHIDLSAHFNELTKEDLDNMIVSMRQSGLAHNSISSYARVFRTFLKWCRENGYTELSLPNYKDRETVKETYTDEELEKLLRKPSASCDFCEYRNWTIINFLLNCGCRAATIRNIQNQDVDFEKRQIVFRHTKNGKIQSIPMCNLMCSILRNYMEIRKGAATDYLFCDMYGEKLSEEALRCAIYRYNTKRGVQKTSIHLFRHTFARKYLVDCGGDAFTLQRLLGHSTLNMTKHYCAIFDSDIANNYDLHSPLAQMQHSKQKIARR